MKRMILVVLVLSLAAAQAMAQMPTSLYESFENSWSGGAPAGWTKTLLSGTADWGQKVAPLAGVGSPKSGAPHQGASVAWFPAGSASPGSAARIESPAFDFSGATTVRMRFFFVNIPGIDTSLHSHDSLRVVASSDGGTTWNVAKTIPDTTRADGTWRQGYVNLDSYASMTNVKIGFEAYADSNGRDIWLDRVVVQYPFKSIHDLQAVSSDSLKISDSLQNSVSARGVLQYSAYTGDTLTTIALCVVPYKVLTFTARGYTMLVYDTTNVPFGSLFIRVNSPTDSAQSILDGFTNVSAGDIVTMTGVITEFPTDMNSSTQFQPIPKYPVTVVGHKSIPPPVPLNVSDLYTGIYSTGKVRYSTGEQYEGRIVQLTNLAVDAKVDLTRGTFSMVQNGNEITNYDASRYFTLKGTSIDHPAVDSLWLAAFNGMGIGVQIDTIRGYLTTVSGSQSARGYRIAPIYRGDIVFGVVPPSISTHRRNPVVVTPDSQATVTVKAAKQSGGANLALVRLYYSANNGPFVVDTMTYRASDTTYVGQIPPQPADTFVKYYMTVVDSLGRGAMLANAGSGAFSGDTSKGFFFYTSLARSLTIRDVQYTPYVNGRSAYVGGVVQLGGIVTADTAHLGISPRTPSGGTNAWYIQQTGGQPWSGIWVTGTDSTLKTMRNGDSVQVTGTVTENFDVTNLASVSTPVTIVAHGVSEPAPIPLSTVGFGPSVGNGAPSAEPYEGMLVRFNNVTVTDTTAWVFSDPTEYAVADSTGSPILVRRDGRNTYSNVPADTLTGQKILRPGNKIASLTGIIFFAFNRYMIVPRTNTDFGVVTDVRLQRGTSLPTEYALSQNYPNPFNPATTIEYDVPQKGLVTLSVFNILGQEVKALVHGEHAPGHYVVQFNASSLASGVYFYRMQAGPFAQVRKMLLLK